MFEGLYQVGHHRFLEERRHRARGLKVARGNRLARPGLGYYDGAEAVLEVLETIGEAEHCHNLRCNSNVETVFAWEAVGDAAKRLDH